jgi:hypothetical protein
MLYLRVLFGLVAFVSVNTIGVVQNTLDIDLKSG